MLMQPKKTLLNVPFKKKKEISYLMDDKKIKKSLKRRKKRK